MLLRVMTTNFSSRKKWMHTLFVFSTINGKSEGQSLLQNKAKKAKRSLIRQTRQESSAPIPSRLPLDF